MAQIDSVQTGTIVSFGKDFNDQLSKLVAQGFTIISSGINPLAQSPQGDSIFWAIVQKITYAD